MEETKVEEKVEQNAESNVEKKNKKKRFKLRLIHLILVALLVIIFVMGMILFSGAKYFIGAIYKSITEKHYNNGVNDTIANYEEKEKQKEKELLERKHKIASTGNLDIESAFVKELYNKVLKANQISYENEGSFYKKDKTTLEILSDTEKLVATLQYLRSNQSNIVYADELDDDIISKLTYCTKDDIEFSDSGIQVFDSEDIKNATKELFGKEVDLKCKTLDGCAEVCEYIDGKYYCYYFAGGGYGYYHHAYTQLQYATKENDKIYIYDKLLYVKDFNYEINYEDGKEGTYNTYHKSFDENFFAIEGIDYQLEELYQYDDVIDDLYSELDLYKHTFQKDESGNYYWVSTEKVEK